MKSKYFKITSIFLGILNFLIVTQCMIKHGKIASIFFYLYVIFVDKTNINETIIIRVFYSLAWLILLILLMRDVKSRIIKIIILLLFAALTIPFFSIYGI